MWELCYAPPNICIDRIRWEVISRWTFVYGYFVKKSQPALHLWCNNLKKGKYTVKILPVPFSLTDHEFIWTWPLIRFCQMLASVEQKAIFIGFSNEKCCFVMSRNNNKFAYIYIVVWQIWTETFSSDALVHLWTLYIYRFGRGLLLIT